MLNVRVKKNLLCNVGFHKALCGLLYHEIFWLHQQERGGKNHGPVEKVQRVMKGTDGTETSRIILVMDNSGDHRG